MKRAFISLLFLLVFLFISWSGAFLGDLASIGGYDGIAPKELAEEFWYGKYSAWSSVAEGGAKAALVVGPLGTGVSLIALLYFIARQLVRAVSGSQ